MKPSLKLSVQSMRYIPVCAFFVMFLHVTLLLFGINLPIPEIVVVAGGFYIAYAFSHALGFCFVHRLCIYYAFLVMVCIWLRRYPDGEYGLFGSGMIQTARWIMFYIGVLIASLVVRKEILDIIKNRRR